MATRRSQPRSMHPSRVFRLPHHDAVTVLTLYVLLLYVIPSERTIGPLGGAGSPAALFALFAGIWWCWYQMSRRDPTVDVGARPVRVALFLFLGAALASYVVATLRPLPTAEVSAADLGLLRLLAFASVLLIANDGIPDAERLRTLLRRLVVVGGLFAALGLAQFVTGKSFVQSIGIPGLTTSQDFSAVQDRSGFARAAATAMSPLEYAAVLSMILPLALVFAIEDTARPRWRRWLPALLIVAALALSGSRSAVLGLVTGIVVLFPTWSRTIRIRAGFLAVAGLAAVYLLVPGMIGTLRGLFLNLEGDPSAASRANSYDMVGEFIARSPFIGRGFGTFLAPYRILDNQYLLTMIELGAIGLCALIGLVATSVVVAIAARRWAPDALTRQLGQALGASVIAGAILTAFFDAFSFRMAGGTLFLMLGLCGAYWRLGRRERDRHDPTFETSAPLSVVP